MIVQRTIDDAIDGPDGSLLVPYLAAIMVVAVIRFGVNFTRRYATARIGIAIEAGLRSMLYDATSGTRARSTTGTRPAR